MYTSCDEGNKRLERTINCGVIAAVSAFALAAHFSSSDSGTVPVTQKKDGSGVWNTMLVPPGPSKDFRAIVCEDNGQKLTVLLDHHVKTMPYGCHIREVKYET